MTQQLPPGFEVVQDIQPDQQGGSLPEGFEVVEPVQSSSQGLPAGFEVVQPQDITPPITDHQEPIAPPQKSMGELVQEKVAMTQAEKVEADNRSWINNVARGAGERVGDVLGGALTSSAALAGSLEGKMEGTNPVSRFLKGRIVYTDEQGKIKVPSWISSEEYEALSEEGKMAEDGFKVLENNLKNANLGYNERTSWNDVKEDFKNEESGIFQKAGTVAAFGFETGVKSVPDMVATIYALPSYIIARAGEIGEKRAKNKGKKEADLQDVVEAAPVALASAMLERIGVKGMLTGAKTAMGKEMLAAGAKEVSKQAALQVGKAATKEAVTEFFQEGVLEYVGERLGTDAEMKLAEALDQGLAGAVGGGVAGGAINTGITGVEVAGAQAGKIAENREIKQQVNEQSLASLSPDAQSKNNLSMSELVQHHADRISVERTGKTQAELQAEIDAAIVNEVPEMTTEQTGEFDIEQTTYQDESTDLNVPELPAGFEVVKDDRKQEKPTSAEIEPTKQVVPEEKPAGVEPSKTEPKQEVVEKELSKMPDHVSMGMVSFKPKPITESELYRETSPEAIGSLLRDVLSNNPINGAVSSIFVTDNKDLALGQGKNQGVKVVFDGSRVSGEEHRKPGTGDIAGREYRTNYINKDAIKQFTLPKGVNLKGVGRVFANEQFNKTLNEDGTTTYLRKDLSIDSEVAPVEKVVPVNKYESLSDEDLAYKIEALGDFIKWEETTSKDSQMTQNQSGVGFLTDEQKTKFHELKLELQRRETPEKAKARNKARREARKAELKGGKTKTDPNLTPSKPVVTESGKSKPKATTKKAVPEKLMSKRPQLISNNYKTEIGKKYPSVKFSFSGRGDTVVLDKIIVPEASQGAGIGTKAMNDILAKADKEGHTIALTPSEDFGGNKTRLIKFYKNLGFVQNKGKNKDFEISETMYREPQKTVKNQQVRGVDETNNVSPLHQEILNSKKPTAKGVLKPTAKTEVPLDGVVYSRTFTQKQKADIEPNDRTRPPLQEDNALDAVSNQQADKAMPNNPPSFSDLERAGNMPERKDFFLLRGKKIKNSDIYNSQKREGIITHTKSIIGNRMYHNRIKGKSVQGYYNTINGETRIKKYGDIEVIAHEMAHFLDFYYKDGGQISKIYEQAKYANEVKSFSYTSDPKLQLTEGYAEYMRAWLTNYDYAKQYAPEFTKAFELYLKRNKSLKNKMLSLQIKMHRWYLQGDKARAMEAISGESNGNKSLTLREKAMKLKQAEIALEFKTGVFDYLHPAKVMSREIKGKLSEGVNEPYKLLQLLHGADQIFAESYQRGAPYYKKDGSLDFKGISLSTVWDKSKKAGNKRMKDQELYFASMRAVEATKKGTEKLFTPGMIKEGLALGEKYPYFKQAFKDFQTFNKQMLQFYVDSGYISKDSMNAFVKNNTAYVAFHRAINTGAEGKGGTGGNVGARQSGAEESVLHIYQNTLKQTGIHLAAALKARAMRKLYTQALTPEMGGQGVDTKNAGSRFITKATTDVKPITVDADQIAQSILQKGTENELKVSDLEFTHQGKPVETMGELVEYLNANPDLLKFWSFGQPPKDRRTDFESYIDKNGDTKWVQINEDNKLLPMMLDSLNGLNLPTNEYIKAMAKVPLVYKNLKTIGITSAWQFAGGNIIRDSSTAMALSGFKFKPVYSHIKGLYYMTESIWNANGLVGELRGNGGYSGGRVQSAMFDNWGPAGSNSRYVTEKAWYRSPLRITKEMLLAYTKLADVTEMMTRVGFYAEQRKAGVDPTEAAYQTRQITTDFQKRGSNPQLAYAVRTSAFLNAGMQGSMRELEAIFEVNGEMKLSNFYKDEKGILTINSIKARMYGVMMMLSGLAMMSAYLMLDSDDEDDQEIYKNLTPDERSRFIHLPGGTKLPKPIGVFGFSMAMSEIGINQHLNPENREEFLTDDVLFALGYHLALTGSPSILQLPKDFISGKDWKGAPIVPLGLEGVRADTQYNQRTGLAYVNLAKDLKEKFGIELSPIQSEYVVKNTFGYYSEYIKEYTDRLFWDYDAWGERPFQKTFTEISFRQFKKDERIFRNKYTGAYYDLYSEAREVAKTQGVDFDHMVQGIMVGNLDISTYDATIIELGSAMAELNRAYKDQSLANIISDRNKNLSAKQKEQKHIDSLKAKNKQFENTYKNFKSILDSIKRQFKSTKNQ